MHQPTNSTTPQLRGHLSHQATQGVTPIVSCKNWRPCFSHRCRRLPVSCRPGWHPP